MLILGPTGSGKTPLGEFLERHGLLGGRCVHFDFGAHLRRAAERGGEGGLFARRDLRIVRDVLERGALLEKETFYIAARILADFTARRKLGDRDLLVLNGLPRHRQQAEDLEPLVALERVVMLRCPAETVVERIRKNSGGDRAGRTDDSLERVTTRLQVFTARTAPLLEYYRVRGVPVATVEVAVRTSPRDVCKALSF